MTSNKTTLGILFTLAGCIAYGLSPPAAKAVYADGANAAFVTLAINITRALSLWGFCLLHKKTLFASRRDIGGAVTGGLLQAIGSVATFSAFMYLPGPVVVIVLFSNTIMLLAFMAWRKEIKVDALIITTTLAALLGLSFVVDVWHQYLGDSMIGYALAFFSALIGASRLYVFGSLMRQRNPAVVGAETFLFASLFVSVYFLLNTGHLPATSAGYGWLILVCLTQIVGVFGMFYGIALLGSFQYSLMGKLEPVFTSLFSFLLIGEILSGTQYFGIFLVILSLVLYQYLNHKKTAKKAVEAEALIQDTQDIVK